MPTQEDTERQFWRTPELVEQLLPFLDGPSTLALVEALPLALEVIQRKSMWTKLVKRVCPFGTDDVLAEPEEMVTNQRRRVMPLVEILKMMEDPNLLLLDLLHIICERFPTFNREDVREDLRGFIQVSCSCEDTSHTVSPHGFLLLEAVERVMGTTEQKVEKIVLHVLLDQELAALESRLLRQHDLIDPWAKTPVGLYTKVEVLSLACNSKESVEAISTLMEYCQSLDVQNAMIIVADIGIEGWAALGDTLSENFARWIFSSNKESLVSARREDLWAIWKCATEGWAVLDITNNTLERFQEWELFEMFLDGEDDVNENEGEDGGDM